LEKLKTDPSVETLGEQIDLYAKCSFGHRFENIPIFCMSALKIHQKSNSCTIIMKTISVVWYTR